MCVRSSKHDMQVLLSSFLEARKKREREREREGNSLETVFQEAVFLKSTLVLQEWGDSVHRYVVDNEMNVIWNDKHLWAP